MSQSTKISRKDVDRRKDDLGPPSGWKERRHSPERRLPVVREDEVTEEEFFRIFLLVRQAFQKAQLEQDNEAFVAAWPGK